MVDAKPPNFDDILVARRGIGPGFDFLRIALAGSIVIFHAFELTGNDWIHSARPFWFCEYSFVPMFFALSGFLITSSATRLSLKNFLINRSLRIVPALAVDIAVCALVIGPLVTVTPLRAYFLDTEFFQYFLNITGWIHYRLPGVFQKNPGRNVNGSLWTVPYEIGCYVMMSIFIVTRWIEAPRKVALTAICVMILGTAEGHGGLRLIGIRDDMLFCQFDNRDIQLLLAFLLGVIAYQLRARIVYSQNLFYISIGFCLFDMFCFHQGLFSSFIALPALVYITIFLGLTDIKIPSLFHRGDYSYGIYLYHYPFLQLLVSLSPGIFCARIFGPSLLAAIGLPIVFWAAFGSWHLVEKPILSLRKKFSFVARVRGVSS